MQVRRVRLTHPRGRGLERTRVVEVTRLPLAGLYGQPSFCVLWKRSRTLSG